MEIAERIAAEGGAEIVWTKLSTSHLMDVAGSGAVVNGADFVVTTGGTGLGPRDVTPQATSMLIDYEVPGLGELMRRAGQASTPMATTKRPAT